MTEKLKIEISTQFTQNELGEICPDTVLILSTNTGTVKIPCVDGQTNAMVQDACRFFSKYLKTSEMEISFEKNRNTMFLRD